MSAVVKYPVPLALTLKPGAKSFVILRGESFTDTTTVDITYVDAGANKYHWQSIAVKARGTAHKWLEAVLQLVSVTPHVAHPRDTTDQVTITVDSTSTASAPADLYNE